MFTFKNVKLRLRHPVASLIATLVLIFIVLILYR